MATTTFVIDCAYTDGSDPVKVQVTVTENGDGTLTFTLTQLSGYIGDLRGFFFDLADENLIGTLSVAGTGFTELQQGDDSVYDLGNGATMAGGYTGDDAACEISVGPGNGTDNFDVGIEIGTQGANPDFYSTFTFTLDSSGEGSRDLTLADLQGELVGVRLTSTSDGDPDTADSGSTKVVGIFQIPPPPPEWEGLTKGYWMNHVSDWGTQDTDGNTTAAVSTSQSFEAFFGVEGTAAGGKWVTGNGKTGFTYSNDVDFMKALSGPAYGSAANILASQAVAAVLNAYDEDINYQWDVATIKAAVQSVWGNDAAMIELAAQLDAWNNLGDVSAGS